MVTQCHVNEGVIHPKSSYKIMDPVSRASPKIYNESLQLKRLIHSTSLGQSQLLRYSIVSVSCVSLTGERRVELGPVSNMSTIVS